MSTIKEREAKDRLSKVQVNPRYILRYKKPSIDLVRAALKKSPSLISEISGVRDLPETILIETFEKLYEHKTPINLLDVGGATFLKEASSKLLKTIAASYATMGTMGRREVENAVSSRIEQDGNFFAELAGINPPTSSVQYFFRKYFDRKDTDIAKLKALASTYPHVFSYGLVNDFLESPDSGLSVNEVKQLYMNALETGFHIKSIPSNLQNDIDIMVTALTHNFNAVSSFNLKFFSPFDHLAPHIDRLQNAIIAGLKKLVATGDDIKFTDTLPKDLLKTNDFARRLIETNGVFFSSLPSSYQTKVNFDLALQTSYEPISTNTLMLSEESLYPLRPEIDLFIDAIPSEYLNDRFFSKVCDLAKDESFRLGSQRAVNLRWLIDNVNPSNVKVETIEKLLLLPQWKERYTKNLEVVDFPPKWLTETTVIRLVELGLPINNLDHRLVTDKVKANALKHDSLIPVGAQTADWIKKYLLKTSAKGSVATKEGLSTHILTPEFFLKLASASGQPDFLKESVSDIGRLAAESINKHATTSETVVEMVSNGLNTNRIPKGLKTLEFMYQLSISGIESSIYKRYCRSEKDKIEMYFYSDRGRFLSLFGRDFSGDKQSSPHSSIDEGLYNEIHVAYRASLLAEKAAALSSSEKMVNTARLSL